MKQAEAAGNFSYIPSGVPNDDAIEVIIISFSVFRRVSFFNIWV